MLSTHVTGYRKIAGPDFEKAYGAASEYIKSPPHGLGYELTHCMEEPDRFILRIEWKSVEEHLQGFRKEENFKNFFRLVQPFIANIEEMQHYERTPVAHHV